jgi:basic amino acid/polyamine antiporter, APA family
MRPRRLVVGVNILGARRSGRLNDVLTVAKLVPLGVIIIAAAVFVAVHPGSATTNFTPFAPLGWGGFGTAVVLIFWAYAGFELSVLPAGEVENPRKTLPRGLLFGIAIATFVYLGVAVATVVAIPSPAAAASPRPLTEALAALSAGLGLSSRPAAAFLSAGALISIVGVCDVYMLSVARLSYALARERSFPGVFATMNPRYQTPWVGLVFQGALAIGASLWLDISSVLQTAVFFLGLVYAGTGLTALRLAKQAPERALHVPGLRLWLWLSVPAGIYLSLQASRMLMAGGAIGLAAGFVAYRLHRPRQPVVFESGDNAG